MKYIKSTPMLSVVKPGALHVLQQVFGTDTTDNFIFNSLLDYGGDCYNDGYDRKCVEIKLFKGRRHEALDKDWAKALARINKTIFKNKHK